ncbi:hypothetical protein B4U79_03213, partial [Dinothrombium tinctorium]
MCTAPIYLKERCSMQSESNNCDSEQFSREKATKMPMQTSLKPVVESPNVRYSEETIEADYEYENTRCSKDENGVLKVFPMKTLITFRTQRKVPKLGLMLVGWGGNNGSTVTGAIIANKHQMSWNTKEGVVKANYFGSITQASTVLIGKDYDGKDVYIPMKELLPMVNPNDIILDGWDISGLNLAQAMERARVLDYNLQEKLRPYMEKMKPRAAIYDPDFIAANQDERADNVLQTKDKWEQVTQVRKDIRDFKAK